MPAIVVQDKEGSEKYIAHDIKAAEVSTWLQDYLVGYLFNFLLSQTNHLALVLFWYQVLRDYRERCWWVLLNNVTNQGLTQLGFGLIDIHYHTWCLVMVLGFVRDSYYFYSAQIPHLVLFSCLCLFFSWVVCLLVVYIFTLFLVCRMERWNHL